MANYEETLNRQWKDLPKVQVLPCGSWEVVGQNMAYVESQEAGKSNKVLAFLKARSPMDDVDEAQLAELKGPNGSTYDPSINTIVHTIWVDDDAKWDGVRDFLKIFTGMSDDEIDSMTQLESFKKFKGSHAVAVLGERAYTDATGNMKRENTVKSVVPIA